MSWTIQKPPNPIIIDDSGNQVSGTSVVWVDKNNTVITNTSVISQPSADTWLAPSGTEFSSETQNQQMQSANTLQMQTGRCGLQMYMPQHTLLQTYT